MITPVQIAQNRHFSWFFRVCYQTHKEYQIISGINKNCLGINRSYFANKKYVVHPPRAITSCTIEIILVSLAFDDRVAGAPIRLAWASDRCSLLQFPLNESTVRRSVSSKSVYCNQVSPEMCFTRRK